VTSNSQGLLKESKTLMQTPGENKEVYEKADSPPNLSSPVAPRAPTWRAAKLPW